MKNRNGKALPFLQELVFSFFARAHQQYKMLTSAGGVILFQGSFMGAECWRGNGAGLCQGAESTGVGSRTQLCLSYHHILTGTY